MNVVGKTHFWKGVELRTLNSFQLLLISVLSTLLFPFVKVQLKAYLFPTVVPLHTDPCSFHSPLNSDGTSFAAAPLGLD